MLAGAFQFSHGVGGFTNSFIHSPFKDGGGGRALLGLAIFFTKKKKRTKNTTNPERTLTTTYGRSWEIPPNAIAAPRTNASAVMLNSSDNRDKTALVAAVHYSRSLFAC